MLLYLYSVGHDDIMKKLLSIFILSALFLAACGSATPGNAPTGDSGDSSGASEGSGWSSENKKIVGTWQTDCKVPDPKSDWAERHTFVFTEDNKAVHTREEFYKAACGVPGSTATQNYTYNIEGDGKITFFDMNAGVPLYDIYALNGDTLQFGHGFRNDAVIAGTGMIPEDRIKVLNGYLEYKRK